MAKLQKIQKVRAFPIKNQNAQTVTKKIKRKNKKKANALKNKSYLHVETSKIQCKARRLDVVENQILEKKKIKKEERLKRQEDNKLTGNKPLEPLSTDDKKDVDENFVFEEDEQLQNEEKFDEFADYYDEKITPKILMTTSNRPKAQLFDFLKEIKDVFPNCYYWPRKNYTLKDICEYAPTKGYTHIMVWRETRREVDELILIYLPKGPTAIFKVSSQKLNKDIVHHANPSDHFPELILNNFNTKVGRRVGRLFSSLCPQQPEFVGRRVVTFHNQRDFIFFRHHRYEFKDDGERTALQEIGPRFTLKLKKLQLGTYDNVHGEIEFAARDDMYASRKKQYL